MSSQHDAVVDRQFGARASAYLTSSVHAEGADLAALADLVRGAGGARVLDLGCGAGHVSFAAAPYVGEVVACDLSPQMLSVVAQAAAERGLVNIVTQQGLAERLPFQDDSFDYVLSRFSAHHWGDLDAGLREARRVLRPGGVAGFVDAVSPGTPLFDTVLQAIEILRDPSHVRDYSRAEWDQALTRAGLKLGAVSSFSVRLEFAVWTERMRTPPIQVEAIRALQAAVSDGVRSHFAIDADGSFNLDVALAVAEKPVRLGAQ